METIRPQLILLPPSIRQAMDRPLAAGIQSIWRCALFAAGADVVCLDRPCEFRGDHFDGVVVSELAGGPVHWTLGAGAVRARGQDGPDNRVVVSGALADTMSTVLTRLVSMLDLELPADFDWRALLHGRGATTVADDLYRLGLRGAYRPEQDLGPARELRVA